MSAPSKGPPPPEPPPPLASFLLRVFVPPRTSRKYLEISKRPSSHGASVATSDE